MVPQKYDIGLTNLGIKVIIRFKYFFSNVLCMIVIPQVDKLSVVQKFEVRVDDNSIPEASLLHVHFTAASDRTNTTHVGFNRVSFPTQQHQCSFRKLLLYYVLYFYTCFKNYFRTIGCYPI